MVQQTEYWVSVSSQSEHNADKTISDIIIQIIHLSHIDNYFLLFKCFKLKTYRMVEQTEKQK